MASRPSIAQIEELAEAARRVLAGMADADLFASEVTRCRWEGALTSLEVVLGERMVLIDDDD